MYMVQVSYFDKSRVYTVDTFPSMDAYFQWKDSTRGVQVMRVQPL